MRKKHRAILETLMALSSITLLIVIVGIDRLVNVTLYSYGLQFNQAWRLPYEVYLYVGIAFLIANAAAAVLIEKTYSAEEEQKPERDRLTETKEAFVSTPEAPPVFHVTEQKTEISPQPPLSAPPKNQLSVVNCQNCGFENEPDAIFCEKCGRSMTEKGKPTGIPTHLFCRFCGTKDRVSAEYCKKCGKPFDTQLKEFYLRQIREPPKK